MKVLPKPNWEQILEFHHQLIESATPYVRDCLNSGHSLSVEDYESWKQAQVDLLQQELINQTTYYKNL